ncbi:precorrin-6A synthase (deacetylating) [Nocardioides sp. CN2-186]|uniref:precorrin-6A synthase (deacetylating) n=1 Tax=Nocardioides tweenelious TaxID=3156607 RepID=UPI0032B5AFF6
MITVIGMGMGPAHLTGEAVEALGECDYVVAASKGPDDPLLGVRRAVCEAHGVELVVVADPERDRDDPADYPAAVRTWHDARVEAYRQVIDARGGRVGFLVWGDPALYDSTIRIASELSPDLRVVPGISAPQILAARHRIVLHPVGQPVHVTTQRRMREAVDAGQTNLVVMLSAGLDLDGLDDWSIWWGANLGTDSEELVAGRVGDVLAELDAARDRAKSAAGWVMDVSLLRAPA